MRTATLASMLSGDHRAAITTLQHEMAGTKLMQETIEVKPGNKKKEKGVLKKRFLHRTLSK